MLSNFNHVGFNITNKKLQLVEVVKESSKYCLENVDEHIFEEELSYTSDELKIISILQTSLNSLTERTPLKSKKISCAFPVNVFDIFEIPYEPSLSEQAIEEHIRWEYSILFPQKNIDEQIIRSYKLVSNDNSNRLLVIAITKKLAKSIYNFAQQNNLTLKFIDVSHFASDASINIAENKTLSIYVDESQFSVASYIESKLSTLKTFEFDTNFTFLNNIESFIENENVAYDKIFIAGSNDVDELKIELETKLNIIAEIFNPFESIETSESFIQNAHFLNHPNSFASAAGISYRKS